MDYRGTVPRRDVIPLHNEFNDAGNAPHAADHRGGTQNGWDAAGAESDLIGHSSNQSGTAAVRIYEFTQVMTELGRFNVHGRLSESYRTTGPLHNGS